VTAAAEAAGALVELVEKVLGFLVLVAMVA
jgi:hypothetical protein